MVSLYPMGPPQTLTQWEECTLSKLCVYGNISRWKKNGFSLFSLVVNGREMTGNVLGLEHILTRFPLFSFLHCTLFLFKMQLSFQYHWMKLAKNVRVMYILQFLEFAFQFSIVLSNLDLIAQTQFHINYGLALKASWSGYTDKNPVRCSQERSSLRLGCYNTIHEWNKFLPLCSPNFAKGVLSVMHVCVPSFPSFEFHCTHTYCW